MIDSSAAGGVTPATVDDLLKRRLSKALKTIITVAQAYSTGDPEQIDVALFLHIALSTGTAGGESKSILKGLLGDRTIPLPGGSSSAMGRLLVSAGLAQAFDDAFEIRKRTGGKDSFIGVRHVLFAILTNDASPLAEEADKILQALSLERSTVANAIGAYCIANMESEETPHVWDEITAERKVDSSVDPNVVALIGADNPYRKDAVDRSGAAAEANAFAAMITARQFVPPLAIGVFGEWGSGKSFFMRLVYDAIESRRLGTSVAHAQSDVALLNNVVQIRFNAWHYAETNLWASLVDNIFTHLDKWAEKANEQGRADKVFDRLATARKLTIESALNLVEARKGRDAAAERLETATKELADAKQAYAARPETWVATAFGTLLGDAKEKANVENAAKVLGIGPITEKATNLYDAGKELDTAVGSFGLIRSGTLRYLALPGIVFCVAVGTIFLPPLFAYLSGLATKLFEARVSPLGAAISGALAPVVTAVGIAANRTKAAADKVRKFHDAFKAEVEKLATKDARAAEAAKKDLEAASTRVMEAEERLRSAAVEVAAAADEYNLKNGKGRTLRFVRERVASGDYAKQLGFVATIRKDFDELSMLMSPSEDLESTRKATELQQQHVAKLIEEAGDHLNAEERIKLTESVAGLTEDLQVFERIILYIDDLDRCSPKQVVDVLQAVNMLLAFPLFVVMVAVDVRWLRTSLTDSYPSQIQVDAAGTATPGDYLEKIFQIPYWVRPMTADNTRDLLIDQLGPEATPAVPKLRVESIVVRPNLAPHDGVDEDGGDEGSVTPERMLSSLRVTPSERSFMRGVADLLDHSPRRTLRFVNSYRVIKASLPADDLRYLEGGGYRALLVLLAVATCAGEEGAKLIHEVSTSGLPSAGQADPASTADEKRCLAARKLMSSNALTSDDLKRYAPVVARFSFDRHVRFGE